MFKTNIKVWHMFLHPFFKGFSKYRSVALVIKKLWPILDFFTHSRLFTTLYPTLCVKKKLQKNPSNYYLWKVKQFHGDSVKNVSARAKKTRGEGAKRPPPAFIGLRWHSLNTWFLLLPLLHRHRYKEYSWESIMTLQF